MRSCSWLGLLLVLVSVTACSKAGEETASAKRTPVPPPPQSVDVPDDLRIPVEIDGVAGAPLTAAALRALPADYEDSERRAWRLTRVLGDRFSAGALLEAVGGSGIAVALRRPEDPAEPQPVLFLTRRGDLVAAVVDPEKPFPDYHGQGGRLRRPGDPRPRISPVTRLVISPPGERAKALDAQATSGREALTTLTLIEGDDERTLTREQLRAIPTSTMHGDTGEPRVVWSLRDLVEVTGRAARVAEILGEDGTRVAIDEAAWQDEARTPVLRANRDGVLKFQWIAAEGQPTGDASLRGVRAVRLQ